MSRRVELGHVWTGLNRIVLDLLELGGIGLGLNWIGLDWAGANWTESKLVACLLACLLNVLATC